MCARASQRRPANGQWFFSQSARLSVGIGGTCDHMRQRSGVRHFANPTLLGGAVIVPRRARAAPRTDANVLRTAASVAKKAFDQAVSRTSARRSESSSWPPFFGTPS